MRNYVKVTSAEGKGFIESDAEIGTAFIEYLTEQL